MRWSTKSRADAVVEVQPDPQVRVLDAVGAGLAHEQLPAHAEVRQQGVVAPRPAGARGTCRAGPPRRAGARAADPRSRADRRVPPDAVVAAHLDRRDRAAEHVPGEPVADGLDLGQLGHVRSSCAARRAPGTRPRPRPARRASWRGPTPTPRGCPATTARAVNVRAWSGPSPVDLVAGRAEAQRRGQLLQRRLPVEAGAEVRRRLERRADQPLDERRAPSRGRGTGRRRRTPPRACRTGSSPCPARPVDSSPLPSST